MNNEPPQMTDSHIKISEHTIAPNVPYMGPGETEAPKPGKKAAKPMTEEEILEARRNLLNASGFNPSLAEDEPEPQVAKTPEEEEAARVAAEAQTTAEAAEKARKDEEARLAEEEAAKAGNPTAEEREAALVARTVKATVESVKELLPKTEPKTELPKEVAALSDEDQADLEAVDYLERNKKVPAGMKGKMLAFYQTCAAYQKQWEKDHPGETFNADDEEHAKKRADMQPDINLELIDAAREEVRVEKLVEKRIKPLEEARQAEKLAQEVNETLEKSKPVIHTAFRAAMVKMIEQVAPSALEILTKDGKLDLSPESIAKLEEADPIAKDVLDAVIGQQLHPVVVELEKAAVLGEKWNWNLQNPVHNAILDEMLELEREMEGAPANVRIQKGKEFCTAVEYSKLRGEILNSGDTPAVKQAALQRLASTRWTFGNEAIKDSFIDKAARVAKKRIESADALVKKASGKEPPSRAKAAKTATTAPRTTPPVTTTAREKHKGPTIASQTDKLLTPGTPAKTTPTVGEQAVAVHFR